MTVTRHERNDYLALCHRQPSAWLRHCLAVPSPYMSPRHRRLVRLVLRLRRRSGLFGGESLG